MRRLRRGRVAGGPPGRCAVRQQVAPADAGSVPFHMVFSRAWSNSIGELCLQRAAIASAHTVSETAKLCETRKQAYEPELIPTSTCSAWLTPTSPRSGLPKIMLNRPGTPRGGPDY